MGQSPTGAISLNRTAAAKITMEDLRICYGCPNYSATLPAIVAALSTRSRQLENQPNM